MLCSFLQFIIYNLPLRKLVPILDTILVKVTLGTSQMVKLGLRRSRYVKNPAHCFSGKEWICYLQSSLVNFLYQCQGQYIQQQKLVCRIHVSLYFIFHLNFIYNKILRLYVVCLISLNIAAIEIKQEPKSDKKEMKPPPEKKPRLN